MRKKIISVLIAAVLTVTTVTPVLADPVTNQQVIENQKKYDEINKKIDDIQGKIFSLNDKISQLVVKIDENNKQMDNINSEIENTNKEIETAKKDIAQKQEILEKRLRELYKSGGQSSYLTLVFSATSFSDFVSKLDSATRLVGIDKKIVKDLLNKKQELDEKIKSLNEKAEEVKRIKAENEKSLQDVEVNKKEQENLQAQANEEKSKFDEEYLSVSERSLVKYQFDTIDSSQSSADVQSAVKQLTDIRDKQLKSPIVIEEVSNKIDSATQIIEDLKAKEAEEAARRAAEEAARKAAEEEAARQAQEQAAQQQAAQQAAQQQAAQEAAQQQAASQQQAEQQQVAPQTQNNNTQSTVQAPAKQETKSEAPVQKAPAKASVNRGQTSSASASSILSYAYSLIGTPYVWGATGPSSFDCSGFTSYVYRNAAGINIGRTTWDQMGSGTPVSQANLQPGDIVLTYGGEHVGIYVGGGQYINAPQPGDSVRVMPVTSFHSARRILN